MEVASLLPVETLSNFAGALVREPVQCNTPVESLELQMRHRFVGRLHAPAASVLAVCLAAVPLASQTVSQETPMRTAWGDPDLQGVWSYASLTPLQRPSELADKKFITPEEAAARNAAVTVDRAPRQGSVGTYNALWFDRGRVDPGLRTSLIVDPPNGRLPPLTPEGHDGYGRACFGMRYSLVFHRGTVTGSFQTFN